MKVYAIIWKQMEFFNNNQRRKKLDELQLDKYKM